MNKRVITAGIFFILIFSFACFAASQTEKKKRDDLYKQVELFSDTVAIIQSDYVDETKPKELIYGALKGMLESLDPHSQFMDPDTYKELQTDTEGKFGGLGIEITIKDGLLTIITPLEDTPAWKAGVKAEDRIVKINDELTREMTLTDATKKMRGKPGETVKLTILREQENKLLEFKITRAIINIKDIKYTRILEGRIGYIRLTEFRENTARDFDLALSDLSKQNMQALILDLRNNPGGLLESAVKITSKFVEPGKLILYTKGRKESQNLTFNSDVKTPLLNLPLVVLINEGSASGSEIVAACLQDYNRAIIIGKKSFGKGSVQTVIPLGDGSALRLTTSKYFTPSGKIIHGKGVMPDVTVEQGTRADIEKAAPRQSKAEKVFEEIEEKPAETGEKQADEFDYKSDNQLLTAISTLKAIKLYKNPSTKSGFKLNGQVSPAATGN